MIRRLIWLLFAFSLIGFIVCALTLIASPSDEVAAWSGWTFLNISLTRWEWLLYGLGLLLGLSGLFSLMLGSRRMMAANGAPAGPAWLGAAVVFAVFVLASLLGLPPAGSLAETSAKLKAWHEQSFGTPPLPGAADMPVPELAKRLGFDPAKALANLSAHNVKVPDAQATLAEVARTNGLVPAAVYETMRPTGEAGQQAQQAAQEQPAQAPAGLPADPPPGLGRLKLSDICEQYGLNLKDEMDKLSQAGIKSSPDMTLRQIAQTNLILPIEVYDALRGQAPAPQAPAAQTPGQTEQQPQAQAPAQAPGQSAAPRPNLEVPPDLAKMTLGAYCKQYNLDQTQALAKLKAKGFVVFSDMTFREISLENNLTPEQVLEIVVP